MSVENNNTVQHIVNGDSTKELKKIPNETVDLVVSDPPYGYSFMGKDWDKAVPSVDVWKECLRVLKPGSFAFVMSAPRQDVLSQMIVRLGMAGFDTSFTSIYWTYASGFPKAANVGKLVDKRLGAEREVIGERERFGREGRKAACGFGNSDNVYGDGKVTANEIVTAPATPQAKALDGSYAGFQPKPAVEVIIVAMKPLSEKTYVDQALANGKGVSWLDDCRIPYQNEDEFKDIKSNRSGSGREIYGGGKGIPVDNTLSDYNPQGRFPANLLVSDDVLNDGRITKSTGGSKPIPTTGRTYGEYDKTNINYYNYGDSGSYSRYFDLDKWASKTLPFLIVPKASSSEKNKGLEELEGSQVNDGRTIPPDNAFQRGQTVRKNTHPTVKPVKLLTYLISMGSRPGDLVLDPFNGSGSTGIAAKMLGRNYVGVEMELEYVNTSNLRINAWKPDDLNKIVFKEEIKKTETVRINPIVVTAPPNPNAVGLEKWFM